MLQEIQDLRGQHVLREIHIQDLQSPDLLQDLELIVLDLQVVEDLFLDHLAEAADQADLAEAAEEEVEETKSHTLTYIPKNNTKLNYEKSIHTIHRCSCYVCK